jgi:hypothetical protein
MSVAVRSPVQWPAAAPDGGPNRPGRDVEIVGGNRGAHVLGLRGNARSGPWNPLSVAVTLAAPEQSDAAVSWCDLSCGAQPRDGGLRVVVAAHPHSFEDR